MKSKGTMDAMEKPETTPKCPYCGLAALPVDETGRNENTVFRAGEPFVRIRVRKCGIDHRWWEHAYFSPDVDAAAS